MTKIVDDKLERLNRHVREKIKKGELTISEALELVKLAKTPAHKKKKYQYWRYMT